MDQPRLLYFADAMCSWCYGFAPEMAKIRDAFEGRLEFLLLSGGLRPFNREPMDEKMRGYLSNTYPRISSVSGQPFGEKAMKRPEGFVYDTEPASRAIVTMRHLAPALEYSFMLEIQRAFYAAGEDITRTEVLAAHAAAAGVADESFREAFESDVMRRATMGDFEVAQQLGIDGFPTLVLHRKSPEGEDELVMVGKGYSKAEEVIDRLDAALGDARPA